MSRHSALVHLLTVVVFCSVSLPAQGPPPTNSTQTATERYTVVDPTSQFATPFYIYGPAAPETYNLGNGTEFLRNLGSAYWQWDPNTRFPLQVSQTPAWENWALSVGSAVSSDTSQANLKLFGSGADLLTSFAKGLPSALSKSEPFLGFALSWNSLALANTPAEKENAEFGLGVSAPGALLSVMAPEALAGPPGWTLAGLGLAQAGIERTALALGMKPEEIARTENNIYTAPIQAFSALNGAISDSAQTISGAIENQTLAENGLHEPTTIFEAPVIDPAAEGSLILCPTCAPYQEPGSRPILLNVPTLDVPGPADSGALNSSSSTVIVSELVFDSSPPANGITIETPQFVPNPSPDGIEVSAPSAPISIDSNLEANGEDASGGRQSTYLSSGSHRGFSLDKFLSDLMPWLEFGAQVAQTIDNVHSQVRTQQPAAIRPKSNDPCANISPNTIVYAVGCTGKPPTSTQKLSGGKTPPNQPPSQGPAPPTQNCSGGICCDPPSVPNPAAVACLNTPTPGCDHPNGPESWLPFCISR